MKVTPITVDQNWLDLTDEQKYALWNFASSRLFYYSGQYDVRVTELTELTKDWGLRPLDLDGML